MGSEVERPARIFEPAPGAAAMRRGGDHAFERADPAGLRLVGHRPFVGAPVRDARPELDG